MTKKLVRIEEDKQPLSGANAIPRTVLAGLGGRTQSRAVRPPLLQFFMYPIKNEQMEMGLCLGGVPLPNLHHAILGCGWKLMLRDILPGRSRDCWAVYIISGKNEYPDRKAISLVYNLLMLIHEIELLLTWKEIETEWDGVDNWIEELTVAE